MLKKVRSSYIAKLVIVFSVFFRAIIACSIEFGNDEVYYWLYALRPDISHFDHPPMIGFFIQFFTLNLTFDSELWIRLAAIIPSGISMWVVYKITVLLSNERAGLFAVLLYNLSIYGFVISGIFVLPDSPLILFWLLSFYFFLKAIPNNPNYKLGLYVMGGMFFAGFALYSKYQAVFLLFGIGSFILLFNRSWLKSPFLYVGVLLPLIPIILIFYWNYSNDFISFTFHGDRVSIFSLDFKPKYFFKEIIGQLLYNNPYVVVVLVLSVLAIRRGVVRVDKSVLYLFLLCSLPLIIVVFYFSLYKSTLPHWTGISYIMLLPLGGVYLSDKKVKIKSVLIGVSFVYSLVVLAVGVVNKGWLMSVDTKKDVTSIGEKDFTMDMYGWDQAAAKLNLYLAEDKELSDLPILIHKWYPGSHIYYYYINPFHKEIAPVGRLKDIHKYYWGRGADFKEPKEAVFIIDSKNYVDPKLVYKQYGEVVLKKVIPITRNGEIVKNVFVYYMKI